jgi:NADH-quinone oxidoreductase subunit E
MLTEEEKKEIDAEIGKYRTRRGAAPEALKMVQRHRGWVSDDSLEDIARYLEMTTDELDSIATCYNFIFRKPVGRHIILICDGVTCWMLGYEQILGHLKRRLGVALGQTTSDGRFTLLPGACLGACDKAPAMIVDGHLHVELTPAKVEEILAKYP